MSKSKDVRLDTPRKVFLYNELVATLLIPDDEIFYSEIEEEKETKLNTIKPGFSSALITDCVSEYFREGEPPRREEFKKFIESKEWEPFRKQIFMEYPMIEERYKREVFDNRMKEEDFFEKFFKSRYFGEVEKNSIDIFQDTFRTDERERKERKKKIRGDFYQKDIASIELKNDGWEGFGTRGITWGIEMNSRRQIDVERNVSVKRFIDQINWHSEVVVRQMEKNVKDEQEVDYGFVESKRLSNVQNVDYTQWGIDPKLFDGIEINKIDSLKIWNTTQQGEIIKQPSTQHSIHKGQELVKVLLFYQLCSFCLKCFYKELTSATLQTRYEKVICDCFNFVEKQISSEPIAHRPLWEQILKELKKAITQFKKK
ncbi:hypothetical protein KM1_019090 [Entamoeba histolytica HM-3:IMSS]|uniref:Uncharacterized protein n=6 Tax=Entamoeba histolytica TaxID=5759 RepID=C4M682_ENTH1|nr:hypothetical protein EHI_117670 [Entamoeba histolytica HM-1:IMSS]EMD44087.1 Hypothetical protein EHI5A_056250 [Entamoeba histolytica KU27]EMS14432.1 hypothetical protein KM1_019090 [Entamoeba histolytica HM-3:IMSS]ENY62785.1 hypothetical protein EHI7A_055440 [Entamoeba histolytica HM-1:IMSS-A]GAT96967.1 hypothetical protein CL6EHI_117670 [Entamoeba histolytica]EAL46192.1 hypothetical protein EHI_117670 [Entamoeba histolytica HM-1:IMSS]|eukprot:XP_651579.1 hypothetical protein EHI_117670 [Entamoeba histolytica HM-1:IMSS]